MTMVEVKDIENAEQIVESLRTTSHTELICTLESNPDFTVINQMKIEDYMIDDMRLKSMIDKVIIDHKKRVVYIYDLKCTWATELFYKEYYLYRRAYIQAYLYYKAVEYLSLTDLDCGFYGYDIKPTRFIVCDQINYYQPLIYTLTEDDLEDAYKGFTYKYTEYPGVKEIIRECKWAIEQDIWTISKKNYESKGVLNIKE
jgi:hypothetical protein